MVEGGSRLTRFNRMAVFLSVSRMENFPSFLTRSHFEEKGEEENIFGPKKGDNELRKKEISRKEEKLQVACLKLAKRFFFFLFIQS